MWKIWIDTGGTFTDCIAIDPEFHQHRLKLLSSGIIKCYIKQKLDDTTLKVSLNPPINSNILSNYQLIESKSGKSIEIEGYESENQLLKLSETLADTFDLSGGYEITALEPVPILAARILTSTALQASLPKMEMRLGTTKGTNALLEKKGSDVTLLITKGFKDLLKIGTQQRPKLFELNIQTPPPLYSRVIEVDERITSDGSIWQPINLLNDEIDSIPKDSSIAIAYLNSYKNHAHESITLEQLKNNGYKYTSASHQVSSNIRIVHRAETTVVNAYLEPVLGKYFKEIKEKLPEKQLRIISSAGAIVDSTEYLPKDGLLSGPAGGILGAYHSSRQSGFNRIITFDMGGTSTDVSIIENDITYAYQTKVGDATIQSPCVDIDTIAAGGGSICSVRNGMYEVGPESAGASPGPACYGNNGPLTIADLNLLAGRVVTDEFAIPLKQADSERALQEVSNGLDEKTSTEDLIESFLRVTNENMASAIKKIATRKGASLEGMCLVTFGGAGGQHACDIAEILHVSEVLIPYDAGILSALGIGLADMDKIKEQLVLLELNSFTSEKAGILKSIKKQILADFEQSGYTEEDVITKHVYCYLRFEGQESTIEIDNIGISDLLEAFRDQYIKIYNHWIDNKEIEVESVKVVMSVATNNTEFGKKSRVSTTTPKPNSRTKSLCNGNYLDTPVYSRDQLSPGNVIKGPAIITSNSTTIYIKPHWQLEIDEWNSSVLKRMASNYEDIQLSESASRTLFQNRFMGVALEMGAMLERTSFSVNIKERLDFSCAILDSEGDLIINAPHIPVHLGSLGVCVKKVLDQLEIEEGDVVITNHPKYGGSHLPDVTLISGVFYNHKLIGFVANRAHHSEIGGRTPGSMPVNAKSLNEEGVIIPPMYLIKSGESRIKEIKELLSKAEFPTRSVNENMADINGALASIQLGIRELKKLCKQFESNTVVENLFSIKKYSASLLKSKLKQLHHGDYEAKEELDDGSKLSVKIKISKDLIELDFNGTSDVHSGNLNANPAIVQSVILYVLRILVDEDIPLNEGLMQHVKIDLPECLLNPNFDNHQPAVVGGNTEVSQRLTDTILKALGLAACSQGTMNNLLFGKDTFGYYETICGGTGAGPNFNGHDAIHQHMTNTKITDPEILELKYPVRLNYFQIREESGGKGKYRGGNGVCRSFTFLDNLTLTILSQHRVIAPYGLNGGHSGKKGQQFLIKKNGEKIELSSSDEQEIEDGDQLIIKTPGGGGFGLPQ
ncbi:hydantoinase B/oxoprolinase family protein [Fulvivirga lutea]|uniref:Hydantoinase B/oxoprolinase family protein n=1 Tax=Fulvivirga lutea TaxID=2810512 RepID=A0A974WIW0_9BACT|nr:hydantoinase B/oxoprolinase family protein [Fulvivirga lutea]QSE98588.1 hydantoinase B/oxoprolinase family protein [Fulvivirga lutea]